MDNTLSHLSALEALELFRSKQLSPVELMNAIRDQTERMEPHINAFTDTYFDEALSQAKAAENRYLTGTARGLEGIPLAVKDEFRVAGKRRTSGSLVYRNRTDEITDVIIERLVSQGAIIHAKTATPEFCLLGSCHSRLWGVTRNPWNLAITPGGSSGGSGASLAAGTTVLATGTDIGGSIRIPAALCGIVGYKPPYGRNPEIPVFNLDFYSHSGPMTRTVGDAALMQNAISGFHERDIATLREKVILDPSGVPDSLTGFRIGYSLDLGFMEIDRDVDHNTREALDRLASMGARVEPVDLHWTAGIIEAVHHYWSHNWAASMVSLLERHRDELTEYAVWFLERAGHSSLLDYHESMKTAVAMYDQFGPLMTQYDAFVCPTLATTGIPATFTWPESDYTINGRTETKEEEYWSLTYPFNVLSRCPVLSVPSGRAANGIPTGIQIVGRTYDDETVFSIASAYQSIYPFVPPALEF